MATTHVKMPEFNATVETWNSYAERLEYFFKAKDIEEDKRHAMLIASCNPTMFQLLKNLVQPAKLEDQSYAEIIQVLGSHYSPRPSVIVSRYRFHSRVRSASESISTYVAELRRLAEYCNFGPTLNEMIRDRLVCGINDSRIQRRLLQDADLKCKNAYKIAQALETATRDSLDLQKPIVSQPVQRIERQNRNQIVCHRCNGNHLATNCRFQSVDCHSCGKKGHIARACRSKPITPNSTNKPRQSQRTHVVIEERNNPVKMKRSHRTCIPYFATVNHAEKTKPMVVTVSVNRQPIPMEVDTGASLSIMSQETFKKKFKFNNSALKPTNVSLVTYSREPLTVLGAMDVEVEYNSQSAVLPIIVVKGHAQVG